MTKTEQLKQIKDEVLGLVGSPLYAYRLENKYLPVIGEGSHEAKIMFIGEAPGKNEALTGRPFCGQAGKILDELLVSIKLRREEVYITNIVKDRPPENRDPSPEEIKIYAPFLERQIKILEPVVIATLGRFSMKYVLELFNRPEQLEPISKLHGQKILAQSIYGTVFILPLFHPAATIYNRPLKETLVEDFKVLKEFS